MLFHNMNHQNTSTFDFEATEAPQSSENFEYLDYNKTHLVKINFWIKCSFESEVGPQFLRIK